MADGESSVKPSPWWRRWLVPRFSLRTLLIGTTLVAIVLGTWVTRARRQMEVCAELDRMSPDWFGGYWSFAEWNERGEAPWWFTVLPKSLREKDAEHYWRTVDYIELPREKSTDYARAAARLPNLKRIDVGRDSADDATWEAIAGIRTLREVCAYGSTIDDAGLAHLATLPRLERLQLDDTFVTDEGLRHLSGVKALKDLSLSCCNITDDGVHRLAGLTQLEELGLCGTVVGDDSAKIIAQFTKLTDLDLSYTRVTSAGVAELRGLVALKQLHIHANEIDDKAAATIGGLPRLRMVLLDDTGCGAKTIQTLSQSPSIEHVRLPENMAPRDAVPLLDAPKFESVTVGEDTFTRDFLSALVDRASKAPGARFETVRLTCNDWRLLAKNAPLTTLTVRNGLVGDAELAEIANIPTLTELDLAGSAITDEGLAHVARLTNLVTLEIRGGRFTDEGIARLASLKALQTLALDDCQSLGQRALDTVAMLSAIKTLNLKAQGDVPPPNEDPMRQAFAKAKSLKSATWGKIELGEDELQVFLGRKPPRSSIDWPAELTLPAAHAQVLPRSYWLSLKGDRVPSSVLATAGPHADHVVLIDRPIDAELVDWRTAIPELKEFEAWRCRIEPREMTRLLSSPVLRSVLFDSCELSPETIDALADGSARLDHVALRGATVPSTVLERLVHPNLHWLTLRQCRLEVDAVDVLIRRGKNLRSLDLNLTEGVGPGVFERFDSFPNLERLAVDLELPWNGKHAPIGVQRWHDGRWFCWDRSRQNEPIIGSEDDLPFYVVGELDDPDSLGIWGPDGGNSTRIRDWPFDPAERKISRPTFADLADNPRVWFADLSGEKIDDWAALERTRLREVDLSGGAMDDAAVAQLARHGSRLRRIDLDDNPITDAAIDDLAKLRFLDVLRIRRTKITPEGARRLKKLARWVEVVHD